MTLPSDPQKPTFDQPVLAESETPGPHYDALETAAPTAIPPTMPASPTTTVGTEQTEGSEPGAGAKVKAAALLAGAAALANKVRQEVPKKVQDVRQKRPAGRCVIITERDGHPVAIGPYPNDQAARQDSIKVTGTPRIVELTSQQAYFGPQQRGAGTAP